LELLTPAVDPTQHFYADGLIPGFEVEASTRGPLVLRSPQWSFTQNPILQKQFFLSAKGTDPTGKEAALSFVIDDVYGPQQAGGGFYQLPCLDGSSYGITQIDQILMKAIGTILVNGEFHQVEGLLYNSHQWATPTTTSPARPWLWHYIQLDNGLVIECSKGINPVTEQFEGGSCTFYQPTGDFRNPVTLTQIPSEEYYFVPSEPWVSPHDGSVYFINDFVDFPTLGLQLDIQAIVPDNQFGWHGGGGNYYEGPAIVAGTYNGQPVTGSATIEWL